MKSLRLFAFFFVFATPNFVQADPYYGCARLSWGSCDPWIANNCWQGPGYYQLVYSVYGVSAPLVGTDSEIRVEGAVPPFLHCIGRFPDAWRFGEGQCEGNSGIALSRNPVNSECLTLDGAHAQVFFAGFHMEPNGERSDASLVIRLAETHDVVVPDPSKRYTLWVITFDFTHASVGLTPADHSTCGDIEQGADLKIDFTGVLAASQQLLNLAVCDYSYEPFTSATWNDGIGICDDFSNTTPRLSSCPGPVPTQPLTWGRIKATYH